jgi:hypothetical protein
MADLTLDSKYQNLPESKLSNVHFSSCLSSSVNLVDDSDDEFFDDDELPFTVARDNDLGGSVVVAEECVDNDATVVLLPLRLSFFFEIVDLITDQEGV